MSAFNTKRWLILIPLYIRYFLNIFLKALAHFYLKNFDPNFCRLSFVSNYEAVVYKCSYIWFKLHLFTLWLKSASPASRLGEQPAEQSLSLDLEDANHTVVEDTRRLSHSHSDMGLRQEAAPTAHQQPRPHSQIFDLDISGKAKGSGIIYTFQRPGGGPEFIYTGTGTDHLYFVLKMCPLPRFMPAFCFFSLRLALIIAH